MKVQKVHSRKVHRYTCSLYSNLLLAYDLRFCTILYIKKESPSIDVLEFVGGNLHI